MSEAVKVVIHDGREDTIWPKSVAGILDLWTRSLPQSLSSGVVQEGLTPGAKAMYVEAVGSPNFVLGDRKSILGPGRSVSDFLDTTLFYVRMARAAKAFSGQVRRSWSSLVAAIGSSTLEDLYISEDIQFLKPRTQSHPEVQELSDLEGKATILLSCSVSARACTGYDDTSGNNIIFSSDDSYILPSSSLSSEEEDIDVAGSFSALDVPVNAHILPGRGKRVSCLMPVVCVADESEIEMLVTSVVCQRYVWNMDMPVVGVSLSSLDTTATCIIGWMNDKDDLDPTPTVHLLLRHGAEKVDPVNGRYDLLDAASVLRFSQFILDLKPYFISVKHALQKLETKDFSWRLDCIEYKDKSIPWPEQEDGLRAWIDSIGVASPMSVPSFPANPMAQTSSDSKSAGSRLPGLQLPGSLPPAAAAPSTSSQGRSEKSYYSAAKFAKLKPRDGLEGKKRCLATWLWDRLTLRFVCATMHNQGSDFAVQFNEMVTLYDDVTAFCWPTMWNTEDDIAKCDLSLEHLRQALFDDYDACKGELSGIKEMGPDDPAFKAVESYMSVFLNAVSQASVNQGSAKVNLAPECAARSEWDHLFKIICCPPSEAPSESFFVERTIHLPRNKAVALGPDFPAQEQATLQFNLLESQLSPDLRLSVRLDTMRLILAAAGNMASVKQGYSVKPEERTFEPSDAVVDGVYCFELALELDSKKSPAVVASSSSTFPPAPSPPPRWPWASTLMKFIGKDEQPSEADPICKAIPNVKLQDVHRECILCPAIAQQWPKLDGSLSSMNSLADITKLYVPFMFAEYKREDGDTWQAFHQIEMYCIAGVESLASIGVTDYPVWGVFTVGTVGSILVAWKSTKSTSAPKSPATAPRVQEVSNTADYNVLIDRNIKTFDLTRPLEAFHFVTSVHRIYRSQDKLKDKLKNVDLKAFLKSPSHQAWMMPPRPKVAKHPNESRLKSQKPATT